MADLSDFFSAGLQIATAYAGAPRVNDVQPFFVSGGPQGYPPGGGFNLADMNQPGGGIPGYDVIPEPSARACGGSPVYKKVCGGYRWVYPKRRRRKQLLTKSDAAGLAQLKGIVGVGKTMSSWIATHPS